MNTTSLHSYHGQREVVCDDKYKEPPGFEVRHLNLNETEVQEVVRAYEKDISTFHKVDLKSVYAVATGHEKDMLPLLKGQITPWIGKQIFSVVPPGSKCPLMYTPASAAIKRWGDPAVLEAGERMNRVLVPRIPSNAQVKLTVLTKIIADDDAEIGHEQHRSLRHELMMICHTMQQPHASRAGTMKGLRVMAYWPSAETDVEQFCDTCDECLANRSPMTRLGSTMTSTRRFGVMIDRQTEVR